MVPNPVAPSFKSRSLLSQQQHSFSILNNNMAYFALQSQHAITIYLKSKQLMRFCFVLLLSSLIFSLWRLVFALLLSLHIGCRPDSLVFGIASFLFFEAAVKHTVCFVGPVLRRYKQRQREGEPNEGTRGSCQFTSLAICILASAGLLIQKRLYGGGLTEPTDQRRAQNLAEVSCRLGIYIRTGGIV